MTTTPPASPPPPEPPGLAEERLVFRYHDGQRWRSADPYRVERLIAQGLTGQPLDKVIECARAPVAAVSHPAVEKLLKAACLAFGLTPVQEDGSGHTERTQWRVLTEFLKFKQSVKAGFFPTATSPPATAPPPSPSPPMSNTRSG